MVVYVYQLMIFSPITSHQGKDTLTNFRLWLTLINFILPLCNYTLEFTPPSVISSPTLYEFCTNLHNHYDHTCALQSFWFLHSIKYNNNVMEDWSDTPLNFLLYSASHIYTWMTSRGSVAIRLIPLK